MILCKDVHALLHVISLVDWPKHVKFFFFFFVSSLELSLKLPDLFCLDPRVAPSQGVVQCTYVKWFLP